MHNTEKYREKNTQKKHKHREITHMQKKIEYARKYKIKTTRLVS